MSKHLIHAVIERTSAKTTAAREKRKGKSTPSAYLTIWNDATSFRASDGVAPTQKNLAMLARAMNRLALADAKRKREFLEWSVENWVEVGQRKFGALRGSYPELPDLAFFVASISQFYSAYCAKGSPQVLSKNPDKELQALRNRVADLERQLIIKDGEIKRLNDKLAATERAARKRGKSATQGLSKWD